VFSKLTRSVFAKATLQRWVRARCGDAVPGWGCPARSDSICYPIRVSRQGSGENCFTIQLKNTFVLPAVKRAEGRSR